MPWSARNAELRYWWRRYVRLYMEKRQQRYRSDHARKRGEPRRYRGEMPIGLRLTLALPQRHENSPATRRKFRAYAEHPTRISARVRILRCRRIVADPG